MYFSIEKTLYSKSNQASSQVALLKISSYQLLMIFNNQWIKIMRWEKSFLDKSEPSDKVWHTKLQFKSESNSIKIALLIFIKDVLPSCKRKVVLNWQHSKWTEVLAGISQDFTIGLLLFLKLYKRLVRWSFF